MIDINVLQQDLTAQLALVTAKKVSAEELNQQQMALIKKLNPTINAFISVNEALGEHAAENLANPLAKSALANNILSGLTIAVKDNIDVQGFNTTAGLEILRESTPTNDAFVVKKLRRAGANFSGKLNMHEGALGATNQNAHYGNCANPHNVSLTPGGSSGGSGAAVSACMTPLALGSDTMGSVRIPASYCGVFGLKPSRGAFSNNGTVACSRILDTIGPLARSARDLSLAFNLMVGFDMHDAYSQSLTFNKPAYDKPILLIPDDLSLLGVDDDIIDDFNQNIEAFKAMGCQLKTFAIDHYNFSAARRAGLIICEAEMRVEHAAHWQNNREQFSPYLESLLTYIDTKSPMDVIKAERVLDNAIIEARNILSEGDFMLMPTTPQRAFSFNEAIPANQADLTSLANQAGLPAVSLPMKSSHALPCGMQIVGKHGSDVALLALAEQWQTHTQFEYKIPATICELLSA